MARVAANVIAAPPAAVRGRRQFVDSMVLFPGWLTWKARVSARTRQPLGGRSGPVGLRDASRSVDGNAGSRPFIVGVGASGVWPVAAEL